MNCFVTGGAGFIGSHMVDRLMDNGHQVVVYDNLSLGRKEFLEAHNHFGKARFVFIKGELLDPKKLRSAMKGADVVFHFAANSDIIKSARETTIDLEQGTIATYNVLEAMRLNGVKKIVFTSSNVVYGEVTKLPISESYGPLLPISLYGASKLACEGLISAYCHNFGMQSWIYRFANIMGERSTHGVVVDFYRKLQKNSKELEVLGNGKQSKPYVTVHDCVDGMLFGFSHANQSVNLFNLATEGRTSVTLIANEVLKAMEVDASLKFTGGIRGWLGDVHTVSLDSSRLLKLGWEPKFSTSDQAMKVSVREMISELKENRYGR